MEIIVHVLITPILNPNLRGLHMDWSLKTLRI